MVAHLIHKNQNQADGENSPALIRREKHMKTTVTRSDFHAAFNQVRPDQFSRDARNALFDWLSEIEQDTGEEMELDVVSICCDWTEYASAVEAAEAYGWEADEPTDERSDMSDREAMAFLSEETTVLDTDSGSVLVLNF